MEDQLITFETAKLAKDKGFKEEVIKHYFHKGLYEGDPLDYNTPSEHYNNPNIYSAPTQSLLQKYIREVYYLHIDILAVANGNHFIFKIIDLKTRKKLYTGEPHVRYDLYEDCLEAGLQKSLKTIDLYVS
jgi:hypothetical protein